MLKNLPLKQKLALNIILSWASIAALFWYILLPSYRQIGDIGRQINKEKDALQTKYERGEVVERLKKNLEEIEPRMAEMEKYFINRNRELEFITYMEGIAEQEELEQKINLGQPSGASGFSTASCGISLSADFEDFYGYLINLRRNSYLINIKDLAISSGSAAPAAPSRGRAVPVAPIVTGSGALSINLNTITYWK